MGIYINGKRINTLNTEVLFDEKNVRIIYTCEKPSGIFANIDELNAAFPNGSNKTYITSDNNHWWLWNGSKWQEGGNYSIAGVNNYDDVIFNSLEIQNKIKSQLVPVNHACFNLGSSSKFWQNIYGVKLCTIEGLQFYGNQPTAEGKYDTKYGSIVADLDFIKVYDKYGNKIIAFGSNEIKILQNVSGNINNFELDAATISLGEGSMGYHYNHKKVLLDSESVKMRLGNAENDYLFLLEDRTINENNDILKVYLDEENKPHLTHYGKEIITSAEIETLKTDMTGALNAKLDTASFDEFKESNTNAINQALQDSKDYTDDAIATAINGALEGEY